MPIAVPLLAPLKREPAQPPARVVAPVGMQDIKSDHGARRLDGEHRMRRTGTDRRQNVVERVEKSLHLPGIELKGGDGTEIGAADPVIVKGLGAPIGKHDDLRADRTGARFGRLPAGPAVPSPQTHAWVQARLVPSFMS